MNEIDIRRLDFGLLLVFIELYRLRRGTEAARRLGLTQSAVSHALARLREIFEDELFLRRTAGLEPTARAVALEPRIRALVEAAGQLIGAEREFDPAASKGLLRIGGSDYGCAVLGPPLAAHLGAVTPGMTLTLRPFTRQAACEALASGEIDLAIGYFWRSTAGITVEPLFEENYAILVRKGHALSRGPLTPQIFAETNHVLVSHEGDAIGIVDRALEPFGLTRRVVATVPFFFAAMAIVRSTDLIATVPQRIADAHARSFDLAVLAPPVPIRPFKIALAWHERTKGSAAHAWAVGENPRASISRAAGHCSRAAAVGTPVPADAVLVRSAQRLADPLQHVRDRILGHVAGEVELRSHIGAERPGETVKRRPDEQGIAVDRSGNGIITLAAAQGLSQKVERMMRALHHLGVQRRVGHGGFEHQPVLERMLARIGEVGDPHGAHVRYRIVARGPGVEMRREVDVRPADDLGQQVVPGRIVAVRRPVRHAEPSGNLAQAEPLQTRLGNDRPRFGHTAVAQRDASPLSLTLHWSAPCLP